MEHLTVLARRALFVLGHFLLGLLLRYWFGIAVEGRHRVGEDASHGIAPAGRTAPT